MMCRNRFIGVALGGLVSLGLSCGDDDQEATRHALPVVVDGTSLEAFETATGYQVELESVQMHVERVDFTVAGQAHDDSLAWYERASRAFVGVADAHPNHAAGGEVAGEFAGPTIFEWRPDIREPVGTGDFLSGDYAGYNLHFTEHVTPTSTDEQGWDEGLLARFEGLASAGETAIAFRFEIQAFDSAEVFGGALPGAIPDDDVAAVAIQFLPYDPWSQTSIFDEIEFSNLSTDEDGVATISEGSLAYIMVRLAIGSHEYYGGRLLDETEL